MAQKNFAQMTTKKLNALLATANDEDKAAIQEVLNSRAQVNLADRGQENTEEAQTAETTDAAPAKPGKMSPEELHALAEELKAKYTNHRCQVVPFNTIEWVDGYIAGVIEEKRSGKVLYAIKTDDGRRIVKVHDSKLIRIMDEVAEIVKAPRVGRKRSVEPKPEWTDEMIAAEVAEVIGNVGKMVTFEKYRTVDENGEEKIENTTGRVVAIVPDKRARKVFYRINVPTPTEAEPDASKLVHKVVTADLTFEDFDEAGKAIHENYMRRRELAMNRTAATPQDRYTLCEENLKKAEDKLAKAQAEYELRKSQLEAAKTELDAYLDSQKSDGSDAESNEDLS